jgi:C1A family cysteine protease
MSTVKKNVKYGWKRDLPDIRDLKYVPMKQGITLPALVDLRYLCPAPYDQTTLGSCTANATAGLSEFVLMRESKGTFVPSRLAIYYWTRLLEGDPTQDNGAELRDALKVVNTYGVPHESLWWYDVAKFAVKPNAAVVADAAKNKVTKFTSIDNTNLNDMKSCLAGGTPFVFGFTAYPELESDAVAKSGILPMPTGKEQPIGGHAVCAVGYDDSKSMFIVRNSWGASWGLSGYFYMPYKYLTNKDLSDDFWTIESIA